MLLICAAWKLGRIEKYARAIAARLESPKDDEAPALQEPPPKDDKADEDVIKARGL